MTVVPFYSRFRSTLSSQAQRWLTRVRLMATVPAPPRVEFEQARLRLVVAALMVVYVVWYVTLDGDVTGSESLTLSFACAFLLFAAALSLRILAAPQASVARRILGIVIDNVVASYCLILMGEGGAVVLGTYLVVTLGNGFRYGRLYLHISQCLSIVGFSVVLQVSDFWSKHPWIGGGFLILLGAVPFYVGHLKKGIEDARKRADEANAAKGRFVANVSHEMRTPLNGVIAMADVLLETRLNESQKEIVDTLHTSALLLLAQVEDVLDMAKIEAGRVQIENAPFDLGKLLSSTVKVVLPQARYKGLALNIEIAPAAARWFEGDAHHLRQVLLNLLANAVKFTQRGEVTLRANVVESGSAEARVRFEIKDTGIGIASEKQALIFEPFMQADDSITRVYGGTGLGTTIARQLVSLMGGEIGVSSTLGAGSTFWVELSLPFGEPKGIDLTAEVIEPDRFSSASAALGAQLPAKVTKIRGARVLVAEDNATNQRITQLILESAGHRPTIVENGEDALDALERGSFDIALFDLSMPVVSGLEALKLYKFATPKPIPILILSANVTTEIIADCQRAGCAEFIPKPVRPTALLDAIERHLAASAEEIAAIVPPPRTEERPNLTVIDTPVVDKQVLRDLERLSSDPTFVERLTRGFRSDTERLVKSISDALAARRYEDVKDAAHALKGGAGSVGASQLVQLAIRFEKASYDLLRIKSAAWMEELAHAANVALAALDQHVEAKRRESGRDPGS